MDAEKKMEIRKKIFAMFDSDGSGSISASELNLAFNELCKEDIKREEIDKILAGFDADSDQKLDFNEFCGMADQLDAMTE